MASILSALPHEVLDRIFSFLSEDKYGVRTCRLVCHSFKLLSSPYLITRVVFARRLKTIARLSEVVEHDYFHKYVTELIYDASSYEKYLATEWEIYVGRCANALQELTDEEWAQRQLEDQSIWSHIEESAETQPIPMQPADSAQDGNLRGGWLRDEREEEISSEDLSRSEDEDDAESEETGSSSEEEGGALRYYGQAYILGCHRSFPDYHRLYIAQRQIDHKGVADQIVARAFLRLKRLKSIVFTDWRGLAKRPESYDDCARRLFGNTLAPGLMPCGMDSTTTKLTAHMQQSTTGSAGGSPHDWCDRSIPQPLYA
ncbi:hypothetical protein LTR62_001883 [Meristemomyces frigidus]|uniref:F-box domain-containing protein n=1 Tax=Meristemomyces frigidus TaxID=1508187 RepID=A0AAN7T8Q2_9PEZI|nr:hypothetical protein LTR62_001883 [Meristemomyces frigidus]